jgi:hypothetical protein
MSKIGSYAGPKLKIVLETTQGSPSKLEWSIIMAFSDASGARQLGYRATGVVTASGVVERDFGIQVHDELRDVWTTMNPGDRSDVRVKMIELVLYALSRMKAKGLERFEHEIA